MCEPGFIKADSSNLPEVDLLMIMDFFNKNQEYISAEMRGAKMQRSARQCYGDKAVAYTQLKRENGNCFVLTKFTPEHRIHSTYYKVEVIINETDKVVELAKCHGCLASEGGCKHAVAFLMWLHRRSEEPSTTETTCYWKKSVLAGVSNSKKFVSVVDFGKKNLGMQNTNQNVLEEYIQEAKKRKVTNSTLRYHVPTFYSHASIFWLKNAYLSISKDKSLVFEDFKTFCADKMQQGLLDEIELNTREQSESTLWSEMRYGRVTASKVFDVIKCQTFDGTLVENILGAKIFQTEAMTRGLKLESSVLKTLTEQTSQKFFRTGIFLSSDCPIVGASPDAVSDECVVEIKCPKFERTMSNYVDNNGSIKSKYFHQIQLQMHLANKRNALFVVADPNFEKNKKINVTSYQYDKDFVDDMLNKITDFWVKVIFDKL